MTKPFVKSADTSVSVDRSKAECEKILRRYGATGFSVSQDYREGRILVSFIVPDSTAKDAPVVPVKLPVSVRTVYDALYGRPRRWDSAAAKYVFHPQGYREKEMQQAERVAWRHIVLWIDAALTAAQAGMQTITEAFFAHTLVTSPEGQQVRLRELLEVYQSGLGPGVRALLAAPADTDA